MKKIILILCLLLTVNGCFAQSQYSSILDNVENSIFGFTYSASDDISRLNRIEESVYGQSNSKKSITDRIAKLKKDMAADLIGQEIEPKEDTFMEEKDKFKDMTAMEELPSSGPNVDYPAINELEKEIFKKEFKDKDLNTRLASLEKQSLGKTYDSEAFSTRVERLQAKIKPKSFMNNNIAQSSNEFYEDQAIPLEKNYKLDKYETADFDYDAYNAGHRPQTRVNIASVEKSLFKRNFSQDSLENRLSRLENTMFGTTFNSDSQEDRLNRISSAFKATKSAGKYDSNKFSQNMATAMQIGTILLMILACVL